MGITFGMLYWNYCEQQNGDLNIQNIKSTRYKLLDKEDVKQVSIILDHWGKKNPSMSENKILLFHDKCQ